MRNRGKSMRPTYKEQLENEARHIADSQRFKSAAYMKEVADAMPEDVKNGIRQMGQSHCSKERKQRGRSLRR